MLSISCLLSSCDYRALSQENKDLKESKGQLAEEVDKLELSIDNDPDNEPPTLQVTKAKADLIRLKYEHKELLEGLQALEAKRVRLESEYSKRKKEYSSKP